MSFHGFTFETTAFADDAETRARNVNGICGHALAAMVTAGLRARGLDVTEVYPEDHGWDFDVQHDGAKYHCACSIDNESNPFEGHVTLGRSRKLMDRLKGRGLIGPGDPVVSAIRAVLESSPEIRNLEDG